MISERRRLILLRLGLGLLGGLLLGLSLRKGHLAGLAYVGPVPWILLGVHPKLRERGIVPSVWIGAVLWFIIGVQWLFRYGWIVGWLSALLCSAMPLMAAAFVLTLRSARRWTRLPLVMVVPVAWVGWEVLRPHIAGAGFSMAFLGHTQVPFLQMIQVADLFGASGVSFLVAMGSAVLSGVLLRFTPGAGAERPSLRRVLGGAAAFGVVFSCVWGYGLFRMVQEPTTPGPTIAMIQSSLLHTRDRENNLEASAKQAAFTIENVPPGSADLVIWPENAVIDQLFEVPQYMEDVRRVVRVTKMPLLHSAFRRAEGTEGNIHNSVFLFDAQGRLVHVYDKVHLITLAETLPFEGLARSLGLLDAYQRFVVSAIGWLPSGVPGTEGVTLFTLETADRTWRFGAPTCYENTDPALARQAVARGAEFLVNMTSESLLGWDASYQLLNTSIYRAVENRVPVVRVGNVGITGILDAAGRPRVLLRDEDGGVLYERPGVLIATVLLDDRTGTFYTRWGDLPAYGLSAVAALLLGWGGLRRRTETGPSELPSAASTPPDGREEVDQQPEEPL